MESDSEVNAEFVSRWKAILAVVMDTVAKMMESEATGSAKVHGIMLRALDESEMENYTADPETDEALS